MSAVRLSQFIRDLRGVLAARETVNLTEAELWQRYVRQGDEAAFEALVRRHGPMVLGVCRRILRNEHDAEDAFQATFLVLVRRAASLRSPSTIANWLHGVARRTALEAKRAAATRRAKEAAVPPRVMMPDDRDDLWPALDQELAQVARKYRIAVVLCDLEGKTRKEVARLLGWTEGTVASRLARGRRILAKRLARRGFAGALVAAALADKAAPACVPSALVVSTVSAASFSAAGGAAVNVALSGTVVALTEGVLKSMLFSKVKIAIAVLVVVGIAALGAGGLISRTLANPDELHDRAVKLEQQLQQMQKEIARLKQETRSRRHGSKTCDTTFLAKRFKYPVPFEIGYTETKKGGRIEILEVWGTRPQIQVGGQYLVRGKYVLPPGQRGKLYFYETAEGQPKETAGHLLSVGQAGLGGLVGSWGGITTTLDLQTVVVDKPEGEFALIHGMLGPGYFHLVLADPERYSQAFANVYFGTSDNVLRKKTW